MISPEKTALFDFEKIADSAIKKISIAGLSARSIWVHFHWMVFLLYHFEGARVPATRRSAETRTYRMSYVLDWISDRLAAGEDMPAAAAADAMFREMDLGAKGALAMPHLANLSRRHFTPALKTIFQNGPIDWLGVLKVSAQRAEGYQDDIREDPVIFDAAMVTVFGLSSE